MSYYKVEIDIKGIKSNDFEYIGSNESNLIYYIENHNIAGFRIESFRVSGYYVLNYAVNDYIKFIYYYSDDRNQKDHTMDSIVKMVNRDKILNEILEK